MAGLDGIKNKIDPGEVATKDLYDLPPDELAAIPTVCGSLREALNSLEKMTMNSLLQGDVFNVDQLEGYMDLKGKKFMQSSIPLTPLNMVYIILFKVFNHLEGVG